MSYLGEGGQIPYLSKGEISRIAEGLLDECWDGTFPVDIERICDYMGISILPVAGLKDGFRIDAFISADFKTIYVDEWGFKDDNYRYRFSVTHELGHYILHKEYFSRRVEDFEEWRGLTLGNMNNNAEFQANYFAGCLLAPENELTRILNLEFNGNFAKNYWRVGCEEIERCLENVQKFFKVSGQVVERRMRDAYLGLG